MIYILWTYGDGILGVFDSKEKAEARRETCHNEEYYHEEDMKIKEMEVE